LRSKERIPEILDRLQKIWEENPDLRLGQLIENVFPNTSYDFKSAYNIEDEEFIKELEKFYSEERTFRVGGKKALEEVLKHCKSIRYKGKYKGRGKERKRLPL